MTKPNGLTSTVNRWMKKPGFKETFKREYKEFLLSELVLALMAEDTKSVRFMKLTHAYGYNLVLEKKGQRIAL